MSRIAAELPAPLAPSSKPGHAAAPAAPTEVAEPFHAVLAKMGHELEKGEAAIKQATMAARFGQDLSAAQAISLQATISKYNEVVDLSAKLVDRVTNGIKTVVQGQGQ